MKNRVINGLLTRALPFLGSLVIRFLRLTMRTEYVNFDALRGLLRDNNIILAFWHGRLLMMPYSYAGMGGRGITILVSMHRDGELISRTVGHFNIKSVRGSTTRGWVSGIKGLLRSVEGKRDIAITPDGPKGPAQKAQMGIIQIARSTGLPIVPATFGASKKKFLRAGTNSCSLIRSQGAYSYAPSLFT